MTQLCAAQLADYQHNGFVVVRGLFSSQELDTLRNALTEDPSLGGNDFAMRDTQGFDHPAIAWVRQSPSLLGMLPFSERLVKPAEAILGEPCYHWLSKLTIKPAHSSASVEWHQDFAAWHDEGCRQPKLTTCAIALDAMHADNGALTFLSGSHKKSQVDHEYQGASQSRVKPSLLKSLSIDCTVVPCYLEVGDGVFFHANTIHGSSGNNSESARCLLISSYNAVSNAPPNAHRSKRPANPISPVPDVQLAGFLQGPLCQSQDFLRPGGGLMQGFGQAAAEPSKA